MVSTYRLHSTLSLQAPSTEVRGQRLKVTTKQITTNTMLYSVTEQTCFRQDLNPQVFICIHDLDLECRQISATNIFKNRHNVEQDTVSDERKLMM